VAAGQDAIRVPKAAELVASALRRQIVTGELHQDDSLPSEAALIEQFGVSRPTLREAFRILESESLIHVRRGARGGAKVQVPNGDVAARYAGYVLESRGTTMADVFVARAEVEAPLARLLTEAAKPKQIKRLEAAIAAAELDVGDTDRYEAHDVAFHLLVAELAGNSTMAVVVDMLYHIVGTARRRYTSTTSRGELLVESKQVHRSHARLVELVKAGDPVAAEEFWRLHLLEATRHYLARPLAKSVVEMMTP
jgi:DNA-binding FadR family transcriptional regulator